VPGLKTRIFLLGAGVVAALGLAIFIGIRDTERKEQKRVSFYTVEKRIHQSDYPTYDELLAIMGKPDQIQKQPGHDKGNNLEALKQGETDVFWRTGPGSEGVDGLVGVRIDPDGKARLLISQTVYIH
jgi:hypothetical protein